MKNSIVCLFALILACSLNLESGALSFITPAAWNLPILQEQAERYQGADAVSAKNQAAVVSATAMPFSQSFSVVVNNDDMEFLKSKTGARGKWVALAFQFPQPVVPVTSVSEDAAIFAYTVPQRDAAPSEWGAALELSQEDLSRTVILWVDVSDSRHAQIKADFEGGISLRVNLVCTNPDTAFEKEMPLIALPALLPQNFQTGLAASTNQAAAKSNYERVNSVELLDSKLTVTVAEQGWKTLTADALSPSGAQFCVVLKTNIPLVTTADCAAAPELEAQGYQQISASAVTSALAAWGWNSSAANDSYYTLVWLDKDTPKQFLALNQTHGLAIDIVVVPQPPATKKSGNFTESRAEVRMKAAEEAAQETVRNVQLVKAMRTADKTIKSLEALYQSEGIETERVRRGNTTTVVPKLILDLEETQGKISYVINDALAGSGVFLELIGVSGSRYLIPDTAIQRSDKNRIFYTEDYFAAYQVAE